MVRDIVSTCSLKIRRTRVPSAETLITTALSPDLVRSRRVSRGHISTDSRCTKERGSRGDENTCRESVVTRGAFCPNSARTDFHARALSRTRERSVTNVDDVVIVSSSPPFLLIRFRNGSALGRARESVFFACFCPPKMQISAINHSTITYARSCLPRGASQRDINKVRELDESMREPARQHPLTNI